MRRSSPLYTETPMSNFFKKNPTWKDLTVLGQLPPPPPQLPPRKLAPPPPNPKTNSNPNSNPYQWPIFHDGNCLVAPNPKTNPNLDPNPDP